jgi:hypothetical protein
MTAARYLPFVGRPSDHEPYAAVAAGDRAGAKRAVSASPVWSQSTLAARIGLFFKAGRRPQ